MRRGRAKDLLRRPPPEPRLNPGQFAEACRDTIAYMKGALGLGAGEMLSVAEAVTNTIGQLLLEQAHQRRDDIEPVRAELLASAERQKIRFTLWPDEPTQDRSM